MDRIQTQASKLWELLFASETADTYQKALNLTGTILKESAQLIWLIICSVFVFGAWFSDTSVKTGKGVRDWVNTQSNPGEASGDAKPIGDTSKELLEKGRTSVAYLLNQAREQLGLEASEAPSIKKAAAPASKPAATKTPASKPAAAKPAATKTAPAATKTAPEAKTDNVVNEITRETAEDDWPPQEAE